MYLPVYVWGQGNGEIHVESFDVSHRICQTQMEKMPNPILKIAKKEPSERRKMLNQERVEII